MSAFQPWTGPMFKAPGGKTKLTLERRRRQADVDRDEDREKRKVRARDRGCRFPLCGCRAKRLRLEVSHSQHKGTHARETKRTLSVAPLMVQLCQWRHQDAPVSIHHHGLRPRFLTPAKFDGPIAWEIDDNAARGRQRPHWIEVARESSVGVWLPFTTAQREILEYLALMEV